MTHYIAIADQAKNGFTLFSGETLDACFADAAASFGFSAEPDATVTDNSTGYSKLWLRDLHTREFWATVFWHEFSKNDNRDWFGGEERAEVVARAESYLHPAEDA